MYVRYEKGATKPLLRYREEKHIEFLEYAVASGDPIITNNKKSMDFPSYRVAYELENCGLLASVDLSEGEESTAGRSRIGYVITDAGEKVLPLLKKFSKGEIITGNDVDLVVAYWQQSNPERVVQHYANLAMSGNLDAINLLRQYRNDDGSTNLAALAVADAMQAIQSVSIAEKPGKQVNVHSQNEVKGGQVQGRVNGWGAFARDFIQDKTGIENDTDLIEYALTVALIVLKSQASKK